jgi:phage repressor protein C with HTH and peptisase S24 domain
MNKNYADQLKEGHTVQFRPRGNSMVPKIKSGELVTVEPNQEISKGDIVFCKVGKNYYVHLVKAIKNGRYQIANNKGRVNGWIGVGSIFGKVTKVE